MLPLVAHADPLADYPTRSKAAPQEFRKYVPQADPLQEYKTEAPKRIVEQPAPRLQEEVRQPKRVVKRIPHAVLVAHARADCEKLPYRLQITARYMILENFSLEEREEAYLVMCGHPQHLSNQADLKVPYIVPGTAGALIRLHYDYYGWSKDVYEQLADVSPHTHQVLNVTEQTFVEKEVVVWWKGGTWPNDGKFYPRGSFQHKDTIKVPVDSAVETQERALAAHLAYGKQGKDILKRLVELTQSRIPILHADWFFNQTAIQFNRKPGYYDFLGVKDEDGFRKLIGYDGKLSKEFSRELREAVAISEVTHQPRAFSRENASGNGYWKSFDFLLAVDRSNPLRVLGRDVEKKYAASEQFGGLPNGFWTTGVFAGPGAKDAAGKAIKAGTRADFAPGEIASDGQSLSTDRLVHVNLSCMRCHGGGGLRSMDAWVKGVLVPPLRLESPDYDAGRELQIQYGRKIEDFLARDRAVYEAAVKEATGLSSVKYSELYAWMWTRYEDANVDLAWAANDLGCTPELLFGLMKARVEASERLPLDKRLDIVAGGLLQGKTIGIRQYEEIYTLLREYLAEKEINDVAQIMDRSGDDHGAFAYMRSAN